MWLEVCIPFTRACPQRGPRHRTPLPSHFPRSGHAFRQEFLVYTGWLAGDYGGGSRRCMWVLNVLTAAAVFASRHQMDVVVAGIHLVVALLTADVDARGGGGRFIKD